MQDSSIEWTDPLITTHLTAHNRREAGHLCRLLACICENLDPYNFTLKEVNDGINDRSGKCRRLRDEEPNHFTAQHLKDLVSAKLIISLDGAGTLRITDAVKTLYDPAPDVVVISDDDTVTPYNGPVIPPPQDSLFDEDEELGPVISFREDS